MILVEDNFEDAKIEYSVFCYANVEGNPYQYSGWVPLEVALKYYDDCLREDWTRRAKLIKREVYYYVEKDSDILSKYPQYPPSPF